MSRVANMPIPLSKELSVERQSNLLTIKAGKKSITVIIPTGVEPVISEQNIVVQFNEKDKMQAGTFRANTYNAVIGLTKGFEKKMLLVGVGYKVAKEGESLNFSLGFSHPVTYNCKDGVSFDVLSATEFVVKGVDKQMVGQVASEIRSFRPPEPYKGKGVRYADEVIELKETKKK
jgi:large subunit ribosomal protein L6